MLHYKLHADKEKILTTCPGNPTLVILVTEALHASTEGDFCTLAEALEAIRPQIFSAPAHAPTCARGDPFPPPAQSHPCPAQALGMSPGDAGCKNKLSVVA